MYGRKVLGLWKTDALGIVSVENDIVADRNHEEVIRAWHLQNKRLGKKKKLQNSWIYRHTYIEILFDLLSSADRLLYLQIEIWFKIRNNRPLFYFSFPGLENPKSGSACTRQKQWLTRNTGPSREKICL